MVFYGVTKLYSEIGREGNLCKAGFSKEGKHETLKSYYQITAEVPNATKSISKILILTDVFG